jgi:CRP-like cAMP-binding protein
MLPPRYTVIRRGEHPESMFFIDDGRVVVRHQDRRITLSAGSFFGEMALLEGRPRQVSIITLTSCRLLELQAGDFHRLLAGDPKLRETILDEVRRRSGAGPAPSAGEEP